MAPIGETLADGCAGVPPAAPEALADDENPLFRTLLSELRVLAEVCRQGEVRLASGQAQIVTTLAELHPRCSAVNKEGLRDAAAVTSAKPCDPFVHFAQDSPCDDGVLRAPDAGSPTGHSKASLLGSDCLEWPCTVVQREVPSVTALLFASASRTKTKLPDTSATLDYDSTRVIAATSSRRSAGKAFRLAVRPVHPDSNFRMVFDIFSMVFLMYDMVITPHVIAWDLPLTGWRRTAAFVIISYWALDMVLSSVTGYYEHGELEMRRFKTVRHYLRTYFVLDLVILLFDVVSTTLLLVGDGCETGRGCPQGLAKSARLAKSSRALRIITMFRAVRLSRMFSAAVHATLGEQSRMLIQVCKYVAGLVWLNHLIACVWYMVGRWGPSDTERRWIEMGVAKSRAFLESSLTYQYVTAYHWAMIQISSGSMEILAMNTFERFFTVAVLILGFFISCTLVSLLSAVVLKLQAQRESQSQNMLQLRCYMEQHRVNLKVAGRVLQQAKERIGRTKEIAEGDVPALALLSSSLRTDLRCEVFGPHLTSHALLRLWANMHPPIMKQICRGAVHLKFLHAGDVLLEVGTEAREMFLIVAGRLSYVQMIDEYGKVSTAVSGQGSEHQDTTSVEVEAGNWICEAGLWTHWSHVGSASAETRCRVLALDVEETLNALRLHPQINTIAREYGAQYHSCVITGMRPTDITVPRTSYSEVVPMLSLEVRSIIGFEALERAWIWHGQAQKLSTEIRSGKATVIESASGNVERIVAVASIRLTRDDGCALVCIGHLSANGLKTSGKLPGRKMREGELPSRALDDIIQTQFPLVADEIVPTRDSEEVFYERSEQYGVPTKYMRTVQHGVLPGTTPCGRATQLLGTSCVSANAKRNRHRLRSKRHSGSGSSTHEFEWDAVMCRDANDVKRFYAWVPPVEVERLAAPNQEQRLHRWLEQLEADDQSHVPYGADFSHSPSCLKAEVLDVVEERQDPGREPAASEEVNGLVPEERRLAESPARVLIKL